MLKLAETENADFQSRMQLVPPASIVNQHSVFEAIDF